jgi:transcriptional regulator with XRE-family HTH domain
MVNIEDFIKRLEKILEYYSLTASSFADKIGVQRSSMSHLLSGRNKPSLDFIMKISEIFPDVDLYWILNGKGNFPKTDDQEISTESPLKIQNTPEDLFSASLPQSQEISPKKINQTPERRLEGNIEKIVIFYSDGTFKEYKPE